MSKLGAAGLALVVLTVAALPHGGALAQTPTAPAPAKADSPAEAAAAMQRAQRLASNPMRVIMEASKFKRKVSSDDAQAEATDPASLRRTTLRANAVADSIPAAARPAPDSAVAVPALAAQPRSTVTEPVIAVTSSSLTGARQEAVPALESTGLAVPVLGPLAQPAPALATLEAAKPRLIEAAEPDFPSRLAEDAARLTEVLADLTLRPDGTVAQAVLLGAVPRALQRPIVAALEQWRFAPLPAQQVHRVQLVFAGK